MKNKTKTKSKSGFTLVEMAIVLVIIGLVVSSVMVGRSLIKSAAIRATIQQVDSIKLAVSTFQNKYNGLPGDLYYQSALNFGLRAYTAGGTGKGDGNGRITSAGTAGSGYIQQGEVVLFWLQLKDAGLINGNFSGISYTETKTIVTDVATAYNDSKLGSGGKIIFYSNPTILSDYNNIAIMSVSTISDADNGILGVSDSNKLSPADVFAIDTKIDDGKPNSGLVQALNGTVYQNFADGNNICLNLDSSNNLVYDLATSSLGCSIRFPLSAPN